MLTSVRFDRREIILKNRTTILDKTLVTSTSQFSSDLLISQTKLILKI